MGRRKNISFGIFTLSILSAANSFVLSYDDGEETVEIPFDDSDVDSLSELLDRVKEETNAESEEEILATLTKDSGGDFKLVDGEGNELAYGEDASAVAHVVQKFAEVVYENS
jgi:hypothetical protein